MVKLCAADNLAVRNRHGLDPERLVATKQSAPAADAGRATHCCMEAFADCPAAGACTEAKVFICWAVLASNIDVTGAIQQRRS